MLRWVLATGQEQGSLVGALHNLADFTASAASTRPRSWRCSCPRS